MSNLIFSHMRSSICVSEINEVMNCKKSVKSDILPGMGATMFVGSDRYAMVVVEVLTPKKIVVSHIHDNDMDKVVKINGIDFLPDKFIEAYKNAEPDHFSKKVYTLRKNGRWMPAGSDLWGTSSIHIGNAENYRDPSF